VGEQKWNSNYLIKKEWVREQKQKPNWDPILCLIQESDRIHVSFTEPVKTLTRIRFVSGRAPSIQLGPLAFSQRFAHPDPKKPHATSKFFKENIK
jgi:hypothetical protein